MHVHVRDAKNYVVAFFLGIDHQVGIVRIVKFQIVVFLERGVVVLRIVYATHEVPDIYGRIPVMDLVLVFFAVEKFFLDWRRDVFAKLVTVVHAGEARKRSRKKIALSELRRALVRQIFRENVGRRREEDAAHVFLRVCLGEFLEVLLEFPFLFAPGEVGVAHVEAFLREAVHHLGTGERLGEEHKFRTDFLDFADEPFPERERFRVRVVDAENFDSLVCPEEDDVADFLPESLEILVVVIERVDVLVLLRRIFGKLDRSVRLVVEPFRVLLCVRMVRAAVERNVEREPQSLSTSSLGEMFEILQRAEFGIDGEVSAELVSDCIRAARFERISVLVRLRVERVVCAFAVGDANRMNRNQVDCVKSHVGDIVEAGFAVLERCAFFRILALAFRPHLVPGSRAGIDRIDAEFHERAFGRGVLGVDRPRDDLVIVIADAVYGKFTRPHIVIDEMHRSLAEALFGAELVENRCIVFFVAVAENVRGDFHGVAGFALDGETVRINGRLDVFDDQVVFLFGKFCHRNLRLVGILFLSPVRRLDGLR